MRPRQHMEETFQPPRRSGFTGALFISGIIHAGLAALILSLPIWKSQNKPPAVEGVSEGRAQAFLEKVRPSPLAESPVASVASTPPTTATPEATPLAIIDDKSGQEFSAPKGDGTVTPESGPELSDVIDNSTEEFVPVPGQRSTAQEDESPPEDGDRRYLSGYSETASDSPARNSFPSQGRRQGRVPRGSLSTTGLNITGTGTVSKSLIEEVLSRRLPEFRQCYQAVLEESPDVSGRLTMEWVVSETGRVVNVKEIASDTGRSDLARCIRREIRTLQFPKPSGGPIIIQYPIIFSVREY